MTPKLYTQIEKKVKLITLQNCVVKYDDVSRVFVTIVHVGQIYTTESLCYIKR